MRLRNDMPQFIEAQGVEETHRSPCGPITEQRRPRVESMLRPRSGRDQAKIGHTWLAVTCDMALPLPEQKAMSALCSPSHSRPVAVMWP